MSKEIEKVDSSEVYFSLKEGSNYKVMMTYDRSEVVEFGQFKKILKMINNPDIKFLTINQRVVNKQSIIDISPTDEKTEKQKEEMKKDPSAELVVEDEDGKPVKLSEVLKKQ